MFVRALKCISSFWHLEILATCVTVSVFITFFINASGQIIEYNIIYGVLIKTMKNYSFSLSVSVFSISKSIF
jgi:hypothetical protein